jgi:hypothetical protein
LLHIYAGLPALGNRRLVLQGLPELSTIAPCLLHDPHFGGMCLRGLLDFGILGLPLLRALPLPMSCLPTVVALGFALQNFKLASDCARESPLARIILASRCSESAQLLLLHKLSTDLCVALKNIQGILFISPGLVGIGDHLQNFF